MNVIIIYVLFFGLVETVKLEACEDEVMVNGNIYLNYIWYISQQSLLSS